MLRIRHDTPSRTSGSGWTGGPQTPETYQFDGFGEDFTLLNQAWIQYALALNTPGKAQNLIQTRDGGICNQGWPKLMHVSMGGNVVKVDKVDTVKKIGYVHTLDFYAGPPKLVDVNYSTHPELVFKWVNVGYKAGVTYWCNPVQGPLQKYAPVDVFWPNVSQIPVTIPLDRLEAFPEIPDAGLSITTTAPLHVRSAPYGLVLDILLPGTPIVIYAYQARGSDVWGKIDPSADKWVCLEQSLPSGGPYYYTTWHMETVPPPLAPFVALWV